MQETRHSSKAARYVYSGPAGLLEFRSFPTTTTIVDVLVIHRPDCDAEHCNEECDAEITLGENIALAWRLDNTDQAVWDALARHAVIDAVADVPQLPHEPTADQRALIGRARAAGEEMVAEGAFEPGPHIDLSNVPGPLIAKAKAEITRVWLASEISLEDAITHVAATAYASSRARGRTEGEAERFGLFMAEVGAEMVAALNPHRSTEN